MIKPSFQEFKKASKNANLIPIFKEVLADMDTPITAFLKTATNSYSVLLESVEHGEHLGRYSFIAISPFLIFRSTSNRVTLLSENNRVLDQFTVNDPLDELKNILRRFKPAQVKGLPRFWGGAIGYVGYDVIRFFEGIPDKNPRELTLPDIEFIFTDSILIFDHLFHTIKVINCVRIDRKKSLSVQYEKGRRKIEEIIRQLKKNLFISKPVYKPQKRLIAKSNFTKASFQKIVKKAKQYIFDGEIIQVVLSQRIRFRLNNVNPLLVYRALRLVNPSPYMYYLKFGKTTIIGSSPEILVRIEGKNAELRPIAGTRPRGGTLLEDRRLEEELINDPKEIAEHIMLLDLGRNDLGKVCEFGSVKVEEQMKIERYSHVMHLVSSVVGKLRGNSDEFKLFKSCFPAGTVTGAPKIRAMQIIDELENVRRGPYAGAVGYFGFNRNMDMAIAIRTIFLRNNKAFIQAGAGVVADSIPAREYKETKNKTEALIKAIKMSLQGSSLAIHPIHIGENRK